MKPTIFLLFSLLLQFPANGALSLNAKDEKSIMSDWDLAMKDLGEKDKVSPVGNALAAFQAKDYVKAIILAKPLAEAGNADAIYLMGFAHETGKGLPQSSDKAIEYYREGVAKKHADSIYRLSFLLMVSNKDTDVREAQELLEKQAEIEPGVSDRILGEAFLLGRFTEKPDPDSAVSWWKKAVAEGDAPSMNFLARFFDGQMGFPEKKDLALVLKYYGAAAAAGDTSAMVNLGSRLLTGDPKLRDEKQGKEWLAKAIKAKESAGYLALGSYLENIKKNPEAAFAEYGKGAEAGQVDCMLRAATMLFKAEGTKKDEARGTELFEKAAVAGSAQAHLELAAIIFNKEKPDIGAGYAHLLTASNAGLAFAQNELGLFYLSGKLGVADLSAAVSWFNRAAQAGFGAAQNNLAALYERGTGVEQSYEKAGQLYALAAQQGHAGATLALGRFNAAGAGTKQNKEKAWALGKIAGERGEPNAASFISELEKIFTKEQLASAKKELAQIKSGKEAE